MEKFLQVSKVVLSVVLIVTLALIGVKFIPDQSGVLGTVNTVSDRNFINAFGTVASPATLTSSYVTSSNMRIQGLSNIVVAGTYTPKSFGSSLYLVLERSVDYGQTYFPYQTITPSTDRVSVWSNSFVTSSNGVPFLIPGSGSAASGTAITFSFDTSLAADYIRVAAKESTTSTAGTLTLQLLSTNH